MKLANYIFLILLIFSAFFPAKLFAMKRAGGALYLPIAKKPPNFYCMCPAKEPLHQDCSYCQTKKQRQKNIIFEELAPIQNQKIITPEFLFNIIKDLTEFDTALVASCLRKSWSWRLPYTITNKYRQNIIHLAFAHDHPRVANIILRAFSDIPATHFIVLTDSEGNTPLHLAAKYASNKIIQWFIAGIIYSSPKALHPLQYTNSSGYTPAAMAYYAGHMDIYRALDYTRHKIIMNYAD
jgi:hypothetical protein